MDQIEQFIEKWVGKHGFAGIFHNKRKECIQDLKSLIDSAVEEKLQEKLNDYDVGSLEYQIVEAIIKPPKKE